MTGGMAGSLGSFNASLDRFIAKLGPYLDEVVVNVGFELAENIIAGGEFAPGTPIDTGFARGSWYVGIGAEGTPHQPALPEGERARYDSALAGALARLAQAHAGTEIFILSNTAYMKALEYGHSDQAPLGMIRLTLYAGQEIVDKVARQMGA